MSEPTAERMMLPATPRIVGLGVAAAIGYAVTVATANWAVHRYGVVPVWWGYSAPAAVYFVGAALVLRDLVQVTLGRAPMLCALLVGVLLSWITADARIATASAAAFACSELLDFVLFTAVAARDDRRGRPRWKLAVAVAGIGGALLDSYVFLSLAPTLVPGLDNFRFYDGQVIGKLYGVAAAVLLIPVGRRVLSLPREPELLPA